MQLVQADRVRYKAAIRETLENQANLDIFQQAADDLIVEGDTVKGVVTQMGIRFDAKTVVLTAGTFLGGVIHWLKQCFRRSCWRSSFNFIGTSFT